MHLDGPADPRSQGWKEALEEIRAHFLSGALERIGTLERALERVRENPADNTRIADLFRSFHGFAGAGKTFGFPEVSTMGSQGEARCARLSERAEAPGPEDFQVWKALCEDLKRQLLPLVPAARTGAGGP